MNQQYDDKNRGVLFVNDRKEKDSQPDRKGTANIDGKEYWVSAWDKPNSKGAPFSLSFTPKEAKESQAQSPKPSDPDDDLPF